MLPGLLHLFALPGTSQAKPVTLISAVPVYTQCKATRLTWEEGVAPYTIKAKVGNDSDPQYRTIHANVTDLTYEFYVDFPGGTDLTLWVQDSSGEVGVKGDPYIQSIVRANPGSDCPLYEFPVTGEATVTRTRTVDQYEATSSGSAERNVRTGQIAGGVVGGVVGLALLLGLLFWNWRMSRRLRRITYDRINHEDQNSDSSGGSIATRTRQSGDACQPHSVVGAAAPSDAGPADSACSLRQVPSPERNAGPEPSPEVKVMQLHAMMSSNSQLGGNHIHPQSTPSSLPTPLDLPSKIPSTAWPGVPVESDGQDGEHELDAGPAVALPHPLPPSTLPPLYRDVGRS